MANAGELQIDDQIPTVFPLPGLFHQKFVSKMRFADICRFGIMIHLFMQYVYIYIYFFFVFKFAFIFLH